MQQRARSIALIFTAIPRYRLVILGSLMAIFIVAPICRNFPYFHSFTFFFKDFELKKKKIYYLPPVGNKVIKQSTKEIKITIKDNLCKKIANELNVHRCLVSVDDAASKMLNQHNIDTSDITQISMLEKRTRNLKFNQQLSWILTTNGDLQHLTWEISHCKIRTCNYIGNNFKINTELQQDSWINRITRSTIDSRDNDLYLTSNTIVSLLKGMQWKIDFRKLKKGDRFSILMYRELLNGKGKQSRLIGIHLRSGGKDFYAIRAKNGKFYDHNGSSLAKEFLRFPTEKDFRISSNFNPSRLHPVTGRISPHRGIDLAMPQGTPVLAVGDGEVIVARRSDAAGFYITVRHGHTHITRYMHLYKLLVKPGQKVRCGDLIALSGNTGNSTGPHLHYEVWINQQAVNPLTVRFPRTEGLTGKDRHNYLIQVQEIISQLRFD